MYNSRLMTTGLCVALAATLSSCALPKQSLLTYWKEMRQQKAAPLETGRQYEVRKALATNIPFRPSEVKGYTFVFNAPKPPLTLASNLHRNSQMRVRTTAYTHDESDHIVYGVKNAIGTNLKFGNVRSAAADWSVYPVGTIFQIEGLPYVYQVDDYGSALVGTNTIDLYKPDKATMKAWGVRNVNIRVLKWGSFSKSLSIMKDRTGYSHIRRMVSRIQGSS